MFDEYEMKFHLNSDEFLKEYEFLLLLQVLKISGKERPIDALMYFRNVRTSTKRGENKKLEAIKVISDTLEKIPMGYYNIGDWLNVVSNFVS